MTFYGVFPFFTSLILVFTIITGWFDAGSAHELVMATYNVENLFDVSHDPGKNDWEFLPKQYPGKMENCAMIPHHYYRKRCVYGDWTTGRLELKLDQIKKAIENKGGFPDILCIVEIENESVAGMLMEKLGYEAFIITDGPDERGIDLAVFYNTNEKLRFKDAREYRLKDGLFSNNPTRNILACDFQLFESIELCVVLVHFPSQNSPAEQRIQAAAEVKEILLDKQRRQPGIEFIITGDFNVTKEDKPHALDDVLLKNGFSADVHQLYKNKIKKDPPEGTYFYSGKKAWNRFDRFLISKGLYDGQGVDVEISSYKIKNSRFLSRTKIIDNKTELIPKRYDFLAYTKDRAGFSDHYPIFLKIKSAD